MSLFVTADLCIISFGFFEIRLATFEGVFVTFIFCHCCCNKQPNNFTVRIIRYAAQLLTRIVSFVHRHAVLILLAITTKLPPVSTTLDTEVKRIGDILNVRRLLSPFRSVDALLTLTPAVVKYL